MSFHWHITLACPAPSSRHRRWAAPQHLGRSSGPRPPPRPSTVVTTPLLASGSGLPFPRFPGCCAADTQHHVLLRLASFSQRHVSATLRVVSGAVVFSVLAGSLYLYARAVNFIHSTSVGHLDSCQFQVIRNRILWICSNVSWSDDLLASLLEICLPVALRGYGDCIRQLY